MDKVKLSMTPAEALLALSAVQVAGADAYRTVARLTQTGAPDELTAIPRDTAAIYDRLERMLMNALYPRCDWLDERECDRPVMRYTAAGRPFCAFHAALIPELSSVFVS